MKGCFPSKASDNAFSSLRYTFGCLIPDMLPAPDCAQSIRQRTVLFMVQDTLRLRWFFSEQDIEMAGPLPSAEDLRGNAWKCSVDRRRKSWSITRHDPRNHFNFSDFAIVRLFAGERREGDLESFLDSITIPTGAVNVILSLDIIDDSRNADLSDEGVYQRRPNSSAIHGTTMRDMEFFEGGGGIAGHSYLR